MQVEIESRRVRFLCIAAFVAAISAAMGYFSALQGAVAAQSAAPSGHVESDPWSASQTIQPSKLTKELGESKGTAKPGRCLHWLPPALRGRARAGRRVSRPRAIRAGTRRFEEVGARRFAFRESRRLLRLLPARTLPEHSPSVQRASRHGLYEFARPASAARFRHGLGRERLSGGKRR
jgi:hypothetical protein